MTIPTVTIAPGVLFSRQPDANRYEGEPEALIAAGLITAEMVPKPWCRRTYYAEGARKGQPIHLGRGRIPGVRIVKVVRKASAVVADFSIPTAEMAHRQQVQQAQREREAAELAALTKRWPFPPPEHWMRRPLAGAPASLTIGSTR